MKKRFGIALLYLLFGCNAPEIQEDRNPKPSPQPQSAEEPQETEKENPTTEVERLSLNRLPSEDYWKLGFPLENKSFELKCTQEIRFRDDCVVWDSVNSEVVVSLEGDSISSFVYSEKEDTFYLLGHDNCEFYHFSAPEGLTLLGTIEDPVFYHSFVDPVFWNRCYSNLILDSKNDLLYVPLFREDPCLMLDFSCPTLTDLFVMTLD